MNMKAFRWPRLEYCVFVTSEIVMVLLYNTTAKDQFPSDAGQYQYPVIKTSKVPRSDGRAAFRNKSGSTAT